jgi:hypothetical protein
VALFLQFPESFKEILPHEAAFALLVLKNAAVVVLSVIFRAAGIAAVLTLLYRKPAKKKWIIAATGAYECTGRLVGVYIGLCLIGFLAFIPLAGLMVLFHFNPLITVFVGAVFLVFLKFALANPLVVAENQRTWEAADEVASVTENAAFSN